MVHEFLIFLEEIRDLLLMIDEDKDLTYLTESFPSEKKFKIMRKIK